MLGDKAPPDQIGSRRYVLPAVAIVAAIAGLVLAPTVFGMVSDATAGDVDQRPESAVAVVTIDGSINGPMGENVETQLQDIRTNESIDAVVLEMNTPGGQPAPSERMYMAIQRTAEEMPVVASVQSMSASGGYYAMLPTDDIYVLPTSQTGSVGLATSAPQTSPPVEGPSGPDKRGGNEIKGWADRELLGQVFIEAVMEQRGDRIELPREQVATADVFLGVEAVENGFADEVGSIEDAIADAAERAGLEEYEVVRRDASPENDLPILIETTTGVVEVQSADPGYGDVEPVPNAFVYEPGIPHQRTIESFVEVNETAGRAGVDA